MKKRSARGFTLIEIVISLALIGVVFSIFQASITSIFINRRVKNQEIALRVANTKMEQIRALTYSTLPTSTSFYDPLMSTLPDSSASIITSSYNAETTQVTVRVLWKEQYNTVTRTVSFTTLVTQGGL